MAITTYGDVHVNVQDELLDAPIIKQFDKMMQRIFENYMDPFQMMGVEIVEVMGGEQQTLRPIGGAVMREVDIYGDRNPRAEPVVFTRDALTYKVFDLDHEIKDDIQTGAQVNMAARIAQSVRSARASVTYDAGVKALDKVPVSNTSAEKQDGVLATFPSTIYYDAASYTTGKKTTPRPWNRDKIQRIVTLLRQANVDSPNLACLCHTATAYGFNEDVKSINRDYGPAMSMDGLWTLPSMNDQVYFYPETELRGNFGLKQTTTTVATVDYQTVQEYVFDPACLRFGTSPERGVFELEVYRDQNTKSIKFRASSYIGALVVQPKGVVRITNAAVDLVNAPTIA